MKTSKPTNRRTGGNHKENSNGGGASGSNAKKQICDICAQNVPGPEREKIFAFGNCDHYVCYVCSARLRVICEQSECPICRKKLDSVIFSSSKNQLHSRYNLKDCLYNEKYKIYFENKAIKDAFDKLLVYECQECLKTNKNAKPAKKNTTHSSSNNNNNNNANNNNNNMNTLDERLEEDAQGLLGAADVISESFPDVFGLKGHLHFVHKLKLCDLCLTHNKLFPFEYSYYDYGALKKHMKEGEPKTSHRGHPNCELCHNTFFNTDELIQHMSREHYHCHLCGRHDSAMRIYFLDYDGLRDHFKAKHFLCERDNCRHEQFTSAFDNRIDYQLHMMQVHEGSAAGLSRGEARQQRTITLESAPHRGRGVTPNHSIRQNLPPNAAIVSTGSVATANSARQQRPESIQQQQVLFRQQRLPSRAEFPALGQTSTSSFGITSQALAAPVSSVAQFPSLAQTNPVHAAASSTTISQRLVAGGSSNNRGSFVRTLGGGYRPADQLNDMDFPPLPEQPKTKANKKVKPKSNARNENSELTLDQLISSSLRLTQNKNMNTKGGSAKARKNVKQKSIKISLS